MTNEFEEEATMAEKWQGRQKQSTATKTRSADVTKQKRPLQVGAVRAKTYRDVRIPVCTRLEDLAMSFVVLIIYCLEPSIVESQRL